MDKKLVMAVAGSGKTYLICNSIDSEKRNLVLAFTHENIKNIHRELLGRFRAIPENTVVSTFHGFLYGECIQPYHKMICGLYGARPFSCEGVMFRTPPAAMIGNKFNVKYVKDNRLKHYIPRKKYYCSLMAKLILKNDGTLLPAVINRANKFYDAIFIDEYQDYRTEEYELLSKIIQGFNGDVFLVGDYYQHSVSGDNNTGKPFGTAQKSKTYQEYKNIIQRLGVDIDETTLCKSRRCSKPVCDFVKTIGDTSKGYFLNRRGAKVYFDINKQPRLDIKNGRLICDVLVVGFSKEMVPLITITEGNEAKCYRIPMELSDWAMDLVGIANMGENLFPSKVMFSKTKDGWYADIL